MKTQRPLLATQSNANVFRALCGVLLLTGATTLAATQMKDTYVIVKEYDFTGEFTHAVMSEKAFRNLTQELRQEGHMQSRATAMAEKVWHADKERPGRFPSKMVSKRRASKVGKTYREQDAADERCAQIEEDVRKDAREEAKSEKRRGKTRAKNRASAFKSGARSGQSRDVMMHSTTRARQKEKIKESEEAREMRDAERDMERASLQADAIAVYEAQLEILRASAALKEKNDAAPNP